DAGDLQLGGPAVPHQPAGGLQAGNHHGALAGDDLEPEAVRGVDAVRAGAEPGDDQRLIGLGDPPGRLEQDDDEQECGRCRDADDAVGGHRCRPFRIEPGQSRVTVTSRGGWYSTTSTLVPTGMVSPGSAAVA